MATVLITGASGLIGTALSKRLNTDGHVVHRLGRSPDPADPRSFGWDITNGWIDQRCLDGVTHVVHLAGAGIADARWSAARVQELIDSRTDSARLLLRAVLDRSASLEGFVSAAGIGYYGALTSDHRYVESDPPGDDTIARISVEWERAVDEWNELTRVVKLRTPMVLARDGGALSRLLPVVDLGIASALGSGRQWVPWVHLDDLVEAYVAALFSVEMQGPYNACAGEDVTNDALMRALAHVRNKPYFLPRVPGFALRLLFGEMAAVLLKGSRASNARLVGTGFAFQYTQVEQALRDLFAPARAMDQQAL